MSDCKENVIKMIDEALTVNIIRNSCSCQQDSVKEGGCTYCKIQIALKTSRACIVAYVIRNDGLWLKTRAMQAEIEEKLNNQINEKKGEKPR